MALELDTLMEQVADTAASQRPIDRLAAAVVLQRRLADFGDQLLDHYVAEARATGSSWAQIGAVLGVTKQAAQQRHRSPRADESPVGGPLARFTPRARRAVALAQEAARRLGHNSIGTEHLLIGVAAAPDGIGQRVLADLGFEAATFEAAVERACGRGRRGGRRHLPFTPLATQAVDAALAEAKGFGNDHVGTEHLLLGLFAVSAGVGADVLAELGIDERTVRARVIEVLAGGVRPRSQRGHH